MNFLSRYVLCSLLLSTALIATPALALPEIGTEKVAPILIKHASASVERYLSTHASIIEHYAEDKENLTARDVSLFEESEAIDFINKQISRIIIYDLDRDTYVTPEEIESYEKIKKPSKYSENNPERVKRGALKSIERKIETYMRLDTDSDKKISYKEMSQLNAHFSDHVSFSDEREQNSRVNLRAYLKLDPDNDGVLTSKELEKVVRKAFQVMDTDNDNMLSESEISAARELNQHEEESDPACLLSNIPKGAQVLFIGAHEGEAFSSVNIAGENSLTTVVDIHTSAKHKMSLLNKIPFLNKPLYFLLASDQPIIWQLHPKNKNIAGVTIYGPVGKNNKIAAGVTGVEKDEVTFVRRKACIDLDSFNKRANEDPSLKSQISQLSKSQAPLLIISDSIKAAHFDGEHIKVEKLADTQPKIPKNVLHHWDFGPKNREMASISPETVISVSDVTPYALKPGMEGLQQLIDQGFMSRATEPTIIRVGKNDETLHFVRNSPEALEKLKTTKNVSVIPIENLYYIHKPTDFPLGLNRGFTPPIFVVDKDVPPPKLGNVSACMISSETLEIIEGSC